ncbi:hypothetical protein [Alkaliphilus metalliredigens]|uniref:hypothetical protein n=1 Tax=Alkaliphilus metalliredigens TaxID=208226 RepID=UPI0012EE5015|nr:hypothetical protein [Alkaliphilus metalliredigens]
MKEKKTNPVLLLLTWAGKDKYWLILSVLLSFFSGLFMMIPYFRIYQLMDGIFMGTY